MSSKIYDSNSQKYSRNNPKFHEKTATSRCQIKRLNKKDCF